MKILSVLLKLSLLAGLCSAIFPQSLSAQTVTVSAHLIDGQGNPVSGAYLHFELYNCGSTFPTISGNSLSIVSRSFDLQPNSAGVISGIVWPNDLIRCGNVTSTLWTVTLMKSGATPLNAAQRYNICSATETGPTCAQAGGPGAVFDPSTAQPAQIAGSLINYIPGPPGYILVFANPPNNQSLVQPPGTQMTFAGSFDFTTGIDVGGVFFAQLSGLYPQSNFVYVNDAVAGSSPCTGGGSGSFAFYEDGTWTCGLGGGGGGGGLPNEEVSFTNALSASLATSYGTRDLLYQCWDNSTPLANAIYPSKATIDPNTYVITFTFTGNQSGYCAVNGSGGGSGGSAIALSTNGTANQSQGALNLVQGAGITQVNVGAEVTTSIPNGGVTNTMLASPTTTVNSVACTLGSTCTISAGTTLPTAQTGDIIRYNTNGDTAWDATNFAGKSVTVFAEWDQAVFYVYGAEVSVPNSLGSAAGVLATATESGAVTLSSSASASASTVIGLYEGTGSTFGVWTFGSFYRWSHHWAAGNIANARYWMGVTRYDTSGSGGETSVPTNNTTFATNSPNRSTLGFRYSAGTDSAWQCTSQVTGGSQTAVSTGVAIDTNPHTFEITYDGTNERCFIDGTLVATVSTNTPAGSVHSVLQFWTGDNENTANVVSGTEYWMALSLK